MSGRPAGNQDVKLAQGPMHTNNNVICAMSFRHDGTTLLEACFVPMDHSYRRHERLRPLHMKIRPLFPVDNKAARLSQKALKEDYLTSPLDSVDAREQFERVCEDVWKMKNHKKLMPLVYDWSTDAPVVREWLGSSFEMWLHPQIRDMMTLQGWIQDRYDYWGEEAEIKATTENAVFNFLGVEKDKNSIPGNCVALIEAYKKTLNLFLPGYKQT